MQSVDQSDLYKKIEDWIPASTINRKNKSKSWVYGYDPKYNIIVISKTGQIGDIVQIKDLVIALPKAPKNCYRRSDKKKDQYWERFGYPKPLAKIQSIFQWNEMPDSFRESWVDYIEEEFNRREEGFWFYNNGKPTYITGSHYTYLQWSKIDIGYADYREANRILYLHWEACVADNRSFGQIYLKIRRSGFSFMSGSESVNVATSAKESRIGILSKTGPDAKKMFTDKVVPISTNYTFFFKPIQDGMDKPKTELAYRLPPSRITRRNMNTVNEEEEIEGLNTSIDWKNTDDNSYDGEKLKLLVHDESGKWLKPNNILNNWRVTKTCLRLGRKVVGKCMMGSKTKYTWQFIF